jgi:hypothetical protein
MGTECPAHSQKNLTNSARGGAESSGLAMIIDAWPKLPKADPSRHPGVGPDGQP